MKAAKQSARDWISELTGKTGPELDTLIAEGIQEGAAEEAQERISKVAMKAAVQGGRMTPRQDEALMLADAGLSYAQIAEAMGISVHTVHDHLKVARRIKP